MSDYDPEEDAEEILRYMRNDTTVLSVKLEVNGKRIAAMNITNTRETLEGFTVYRACLNGLEASVGHKPEDGAWTLVRKAIEQLDE